MTEQRLHDDLKPLNELLRMRNAETNLTYDNDMAQKIINLIQGEEVVITRGMVNKINQMEDAINSIPDDKLNPSLKWIMTKLNSVAKRVNNISN